jgi:hypothetical protein
VAVSRISVVVALVAACALAWEVALVVAPWLDGTPYLVAAPVSAICFVVALVDRAHLRKARGRVPRETWIALAVSSLALIFSIGIGIVVVNAISHLPRYDHMDFRLPDH